MSKSYPIDTCNYFNIFVHTDYIQPNKGGNLTILQCSQDLKAILTSDPSSSNCTPGFRVPLVTRPGDQYFLEADAILTEGKDAFIYLEDCSGTKIVDRTCRFSLCQREYFGLTWSAISEKTFIGILFFCSDTANKLQITNFRCAPYLDPDNFLNLTNLNKLKCVSGQLGFPSGCTACSPADCPPASTMFAGPQGAQGPAGSTGVAGPQGATGVQGVPGVQGAQGAPGNQGAQGIQGGDGPQGFQGVQGSQGGIGAQGPRGATGVQGSMGLIGLQGSEGLLGNQGAQGNQGFQGAQGNQGFQGNQGNQGDMGFQGEIGPTGPEPINGTWVTGWNRNLLSGGDPTSLEYQLIDQVVSLVLPGIDFDTAGNSGELASIINTTSAMPSEITPANDVSFILIRNIFAGGTDLSKMTITSGGVLQISRDLDSATIFGLTERVRIPNLASNHNLTFTYTLT